MDRSAGAHVDDAHRDHEDARAPRLRVNGRARGARSNAAILRKSLIKARARKEMAAPREAAGTRE